MSAAGKKGASAEEGCCELEGTCAVISRHDVQVMHDLLAAAIGSFSSASQPCGEGGGEVERRRLPGMSARTAAGERVSADAASDGRMATIHAALAAEREADAERAQAGVLSASELARVALHLSSGLAAREDLPSVALPGSLRRLPGCPKGRDMHGSTPDPSRGFTSLSGAPAHHPPSKRQCVQSAHCIPASSIPGDVPCSTLAQAQSARTCCSPAASPHGASGARGSSPPLPPSDAESHESVEFVSVSGDERAERNFLQHAERASLHTPRRQQGVGFRQSVGSAGQRSLSDMGWLRPSQQPEAAPSSKPLQQCPVCGHEFPRNANNRSINQHMDKCLNLLAMEDADVFS
mmetsp:Transcript_37272/g.95271  ORF Transcript_37272/g.95271 Transcript_37272/m.95271 type:complete len:349 (-) Transcript_37272:270-1316(-)